MHATMIGIWLHAEGNCDSGLNLFPKFKKTEKSKIFHLTYLTESNWLKQTYFQKHEKSVEIRDSGRMPKLCLPRLLVACGWHILLRSQEGSKSIMQPPCYSSMNSKMHLAKQCEAMRSRMTQNEHPCGPYQIAQ